MVAEGVEEARDLGAGVVEERGEQRDAAEQAESGAFGFAAQHVGAGELLDRLVAEFLGVTGDGQPGKIAGQRGKRRVVRLGAELQEIDELRAEPWMPRFQHARGVLKGVPFAEGDPRAPSRAREHK